ncbi:MAG: hypothetical protein NZ700_01975 [Gemmataceae bacterium]|nr:hypothetical protein [Gemmataceae bacterium]MDW8264533.1 hypothetical protein [Gemmataceae bacterium]
MDTKAWLILALSTSCCVSGNPIWASEQDGRPARGRVLVLENERVLEGDIERVGDQYRIRRAIGETWLPKEHVAYLCDTLEEAHAFLCRRANLRDADERLRLARWCLRHNLRASALEHAEAAVALRPGHAEGRRLVASLQRSATPEVPPPPAVDCGPEATALFTTKVHAILQNACAGCHASGKGGNFRLVRPYDEGMISRRAVQYNLAAALAQIQRDAPSQSPLLLKAVTPHGDAEQPPIKNRQVPAYRTLEEWARLAAPYAGRESSAAAPAAEPRPTSMAAEPSKPATSESPSSEVAVPFANPPKSEPLPSPSADLSDPFDPAIFNRQAHPDKVMPKRPEDRGADR